MRVLDGPFPAPWAAEPRLGHALLGSRALLARRVVAMDLGVPSSKGGSRSARSATGSRSSHCEHSRCPAQSARHGPAQPGAGAARGGGGAS